MSQLLRIIERHVMTDDFTSHLSLAVPDALRASLARSGSCVAIGNFDGVHLGHAALLSATLTQAKRAGCASVALTFEPHPNTVFAGRQPSTFRLMTPAERSRALRAHGIDHVVVLPFDRVIAQMSASHFIDELLHRRLNTRHVNVGHDFRFGAGRSGDVDALRAAEATTGMTTVPHDAVHDAHGPISSTRIREHLAEGDIDACRALLGRHVGFYGTSERGAGRGRGEGIPTVNLYPRDRLLPPFGVYATRLYFRGRAFDAITNIGTRPTFESDASPSVETMVLGPFEDDAHGADVSVDLLSFIRPERRFEDADALRAQISRDVEVAKAAHLAWPMSAISVPYA